MKNYFNKTDRRILNFAIALLLLMLYLLYDDSLIMPSDDSSSPGVAQIFNKTNDVRRKNSQRYVWRSARKKDTLRVGDSVFAGPDSTVTLEFNDGRKITLQENSMLVISMSSDKNQLQLDLKYGRFNGSLAKETQLLVKGKQIEIRDEKVPIEITAEEVVPERLAWTRKPPSQFFHKDHNAPLALSWDSSRTEGRYQLQVSSSPNFEKIVHREAINKKEIQTFKYPDQGKFFVRIEEKNSKSKSPSYTDVIEMNINNISPPIIVSPKNEQLLTFKANDSQKFDIPPTIPVQWTSTKKSTTFEVQISNSSDFLLVEQTVQSPQKKANFIGLNPGKHFVRVREANSISNMETGWSESIAFQIEYQFPKQQAPSLLTKKIDYTAPSKENVIFKWTAVEDTHQYIIETARTPDFANKQRFTTKEPNFIYKNYVPGQSFFRVFSSSKTGLLSLPSDTGNLSVNVNRPALNAIEPKLVMGKSPDDPGDPQSFDVSWSDLKIADSYMLEIARDPNFERGKKYPTKTPAAKVTIPAPGQYYVRVKGLNKEGQAITRYSDAKSINYKLRVPLSTPQLIEPLNEMTMFFQKNSSPYVWLEWKAVRQALTYQVEVALDPQFQKKVFAAKSTTRRYLIKESLPQGILYWRIQAFGEADQISNWSSSRTMTVYTGKANSYRQPASRRR